jgi:hypothetical protein
MMRRLTYSVILVLFATCREAAGQAGPPLLTDDPGTPGAGKWELNLALTLEQTHHARAIEGPLFDLNYGLGDHIQLKYEVAYLVLDEQDAGPVGGLSNSLLGLKWRFLDEDRHGVAMSIYPQVEFNYPSKWIRREFVEEGTDFLLPIEIAKTFGPWEVGAEVGYEFVQHNDDEWIYGLAIGYPLTKQVELIGEIHGNADQDFDRNDVIFNLGARWELNDSFTLLFAAGRSFRDSDDSPNLLVYAGVQWNF